MEGKHDLLRMELTEINSYARHHFQLLLNWYTFFLTVNFAAISWFATVLLRGELKVTLPILVITAFFLLQAILSYLACIEARKHFKSMHNRYCEILDSFYGQQFEVPSRPRPGLFNA